MKVLIIPDVHGRTFWKDALKAVKFGHEDCSVDHVVFLGDYLDPYKAYEHISYRVAFDNMMEIIELADKNRDTVTLLLGNHDMHYVSNLYKRFVALCRYDYDNAKKYHEVFSEWIDLFKLAWEPEPDSEFLLTHAGVTRGWLKACREVHHREVFPSPLTLNLLIEDLEDHDSMAALTDVSRERGGRDAHGSVVWADVEEHRWAKPIVGKFQIFGHSWQYYTNKPVYGDNWICIDTRHAYLLDTEKRTLEEIA